MDESHTSWYLNLGIALTHIYQGWSVWPREFGRSDRVSLLCMNVHWPPARSVMVSFSPAPSSRLFSISPPLWGKPGHEQPYRDKTEGERNHNFLTMNTYANELQTDLSAQGNFQRRPSPGQHLDYNSRGTLGQNHCVNLCLDSWLSEPASHNKCLQFAAVDCWYHLLHSNWQLTQGQKLERISGNERPCHTN